MALPTPRALLRQERSRETRRRLVEAAQRLWQEDGYESTTVDDICRLAGVAKGTFYFHFPQKDDVLVEVALGALGEVSDDLADAIASESSFDDALRTVIEGLARRLTLAPRPLLARSIILLFGSLDQPARREAPVKVFTALFSHGQARGEIPTDYHPAELGVVLAQLLLQAATAWGRGRRGNRALSDVLWDRARLVVAGARTAGPR